MPGTHLYSSASPPSLRYLLMSTPPGSSPSAPKPFSSNILATRRFLSRYYASSLASSSGSWETRRNVFMVGRRATSPLS